MNKNAQSSAQKHSNDISGISAVTIKGYKSIFEERTVEIRPLTVLAGANSSGKSSIMQPLLLLKQTLESAYDPGSLLLDGPNVRITSTRQILSRAKENVAKEFSIKISSSEPKSFVNDVKVTFSKIPGQGFETAKVDYGIEDINIELRPGVLSQQQKNELMEKLDKLSSANPLVRMAKNMEAADWVVESKRCFLYLKFRPEDTPANIILSATAFSSADFENRIQKLIHVPGLRGNPERTYKVTAVGNKFPGTFENYVASIVHHWQNTQKPQLSELINDLYLLRLTGKITAQRVDDTQVELLVGRLPTNGKSDTQDMVSIADVGFGVSQVLPVLVSLHVARPDQLVYLEEPEIHLHPQAQFSLAQILVDAVHRGVRIVVETHSSLLLQGIQALIAEGDVNPSDVNLLWFQRRTDGVTDVFNAEPDDAGAYGDWPVDFANVELDAQSRYMDAAEKQLLGIK
ncbi:MAG: AAA family ATPase [Chloroflexi bacterium]|nr:AAA family ATPase [Chloroflexota bacterium]